MNNIEKLFNYEGNQITFKTQNGITYVNATEMAKPFGKTAKDYLKTQQAVALVKAISDRTKILSTDLVIVNKGGLTQGTLMHEDVALDYAQWLSIDFKLWCNDRIKELLTTGITALPSTIEDILSNPDNGIKLLEALKTERAEKEAARHELKGLNMQLIKQQPTIDYVKNVLKSESTFAITQIASELGLTAQKLNKILADNHVQYKVRETWVLYAKYINNGYTKADTFEIPTDNGIVKTRMNTVWTEKGRAFIHTLVNPIIKTSIDTRAHLLSPL